MVKIYDDRGYSVPDGRSNRWWVEERLLRLVFWDISSFTKGPRSRHHEGSAWSSANVNNGVHWSLLNCFFVAITPAFLSRISHQLKRRTAPSSSREKVVLIRTNRAAKDSEGTEKSESYLHALSTTQLVTWVCVWVRGARKEKCIYITWHSHTAYMINEALTIVCVRAPRIYVIFGRCDVASCLLMADGA